MQKVAKGQSSQVSELTNENLNLKSRLEKCTTDNESLSQQRSVIRNSVYGNSSNSSTTYSENESISEDDFYESKGTATVVFRHDGCDYMILENNSGYIVAEWMGGNDPDLGDRVAGVFNSYGTKDFYNMRRHSKSRLWIDDYMLSKNSAMDKISDHCK